MYYAEKQEILKDIFGSDEISLESESLTVGGRSYPIVNDVIILLDSSQYPHSLKNRLAMDSSGESTEPQIFAEDIQHTFGQEWKLFPKILPEHEQEFQQYFDLVDVNDLEDARICDLGCGSGRWSYFLTNKCRELILLDFSEAIFVARQNLKDAPNVLYFMGDLNRLPFRNDFAEFLFCLGVLHHLPSDALEAIRGLKQFAPKLMIYLYYALDNRAFYFRLLLRLVTWLRLGVSKVRVPLFRTIFTWSITGLVYLPLVFIGKTLRPLGLSRQIPLYEGYAGKSVGRIRQDVYDRFFTRIEQRHSRSQIMALEDTFGTIMVSENFPYWHFICLR